MDKIHQGFIEYKTYLNFFMLLMQALLKEKKIIY